MKERTLLKSPELLASHPSFSDTGNNSNKTTTGTAVRAVSLPLALFQTPHTRR